MKNSILKMVLLCTLLLLFSCKKENPKPTIKPCKAGVILSFDDAYVNDWFATNQELKKYGWKGSFFISRINTLDQSEIEKLLELQKQGHEIAGHGFNHLNAADYTRVYTISEYMNREINPMLNVMEFYGLKVSSFAYPYGGRTKKLDTALLKKFKTIRGRAFYEKEVAKQGCYFNHSRLLFSFSIDDTYHRFTIAHLQKLLDYAKKNNKILILNSHKTVNKVTGDYQTKNETLEYVCKYIKKNKMNFYTVSDLENFK